MDHQHEDQVFEKQLPFEDRQQNFWHLTCIQSAAFGFPILGLGYQLAQSYGPGTAVCSIGIGNLILWIIALATVSMAYSGRKNAIQNLQDFVGKTGSLLGGLVLLLAFLFWFSLQITASASAVQSVLAVDNIKESGIDIRLGVICGLLISGISLGGIKTIRWIAVCAFPPLMFLIFYYVFKRWNLPVFSGSWGVSMSAVALSIGITLPGIVNLPTFFRHAKNRTHAFFALTLLTIFTALIECASIWMFEFSKSSNPLFYLSRSVFSQQLFFLFMLISTLTANLVNIYFASAAWEAVVPKLKGSKKFAIVGMSGTIAYTFIQIQKPLFFVENLLDSFIASLGVVVILAFMVRRIVSHRERGYERLLSVVCWLIGCLVALLAQILNSAADSKVFFLSIGSSVLCFLIIIFIEESLWSAKQLSYKN